MLIKLLDGSVLSDEAATLLIDLDDESVLYDEAAVATLIDFLDGEDI